MGFIESVYEIARGNCPRMALPECESEQIMRAARRAVDEGIVQAVFMGDETHIRELAAERGVSLEGIEVVDLGDEGFCAGLVERYGELPPRMIGAKGLARRMGIPLYPALAMEAVGDVDVTFAGLETSTYEMLMAAQGVLGLAEGIPAPSSFAVAEIPGFTGAQGNVIGFGDVAVNTDPDAEVLSGIAISCCDSFQALFGRAARCAMVSYSTCGSGSGPSVDIVREAVQRANELRPDLMIDGEFQLDAAVNATIGAKKVDRPSDVAGKADLVVLPNLSVGNVFIKTLQQFAGANTYGPVYQGFAKPVVDCSRGDDEQRVFDAIAMGAAMVKREEG